MKEDISRTEDISNYANSFEEKKSNYLLNKNEFMEKVMNIVEEGLL